MPAPAQPPAPTGPPVSTGPPAPTGTPAPSNDALSAELPPAADADGSIFSKMLSEWLIDDPVELAASTDLDWQTVWDQGWSAAAAAAEAPVEQHTEHGLPVRDPGARLVPGAADAPPEESNGVGNGRHRNGDAESTDLPHRDPNAVRSTISSHFTGVHAGRTHARDNREADER